MRAFLLVLVTIFTLTSCKQSDKAKLEKYLGYYERIDDEAEGDVVLVKLDAKGQLVAVFTKVSDFSARFNYQVGDIKFTLVKKIDDSTLEIANLGSYMKLDSATSKVLSIEKKYLPFILKLASHDTIEFYEKDFNKKPSKKSKAVSYGSIDVGQTQRWKKLKK